MDQAWIPRYSAWHHTWSDKGIFPGFQPMREVHEFFMGGSLSFLSNVSPVLGAREGIMECFPVFPEIGDSLREMCILRKTLIISRYKE